MKDQWDYVLNVLEELGNKLFLNHPHNTGISFLLQLLLPNMISIVRQTNESIVGIDSEDFFLDSPTWNAPSSSRCTCYESRRRYVTCFDTSQSEREIFLVEHQSNSFFGWERFPVKNQQVLHPCTLSICEPENFDVLDCPKELLSWFHWNTTSDCLYLSWWDSCSSHMFATAP